MGDSIAKLRAATDDAIIKAREIELHLGKNGEDVGSYAVSIKIDTAEDVLDRVEELEEREADTRLVLLDVKTTAPAMIEMMRLHGLRIEDHDDPMQRLAFTLYSELARLSAAAEDVLGEE